MSDLDLDPESARYLLGEMTENERDEFEERFLSDDDAQVLVGATEGELFTAYAENTLTEPQQRRFEQTFLRDEHGAARLAATRARLRVAQRGDLLEAVATEPPTFARKVPIWLWISAAVAAALVVVAALA